MVNRYAFPDANIQRGKTNSSAGQTRGSKERYCTRKGNWVSYGTYAKTFMFKLTSLQVLLMDVVLRGIGTGDGIQHDT